MAVARTADRTYPVAPHNRGHAARVLVGLGMAAALAVSVDVLAARGFLLAVLVFYGTNRVSSNRGRHTN